MAKPPATWKHEERWWADKYNGKRVPVTGRQRGDAPDVAHPYFAFEIKYGWSNVPKRLVNAMDQAVKSGQQTKPFPTMPVVGVCVPGINSAQPKERFVFMQEADFRMMAHELGWIGETDESL